MNVVLPT